MVSDLIINGPYPNASKDIGKKKRANRSAKLKQCKLDARREQWLSQVKNKNCKEELNVSGGGGGGCDGEFNRAVIETHKKATGLCNGLEVQSPTRMEEMSSNQNDSDSEYPPGNTYTGSSSSSSSSSFSFSCSGSITEEDEGEGGGGDGGDDGCLDDWEAVADALVGVSDGTHSSNANHLPELESAVKASSKPWQPSCENVDDQMGNLKRDGVGILGKNTTNCRAWRSDDAFRPQSLPNLAKQRSFPSGVEKHHAFVNPWVRNVAPRLPTLCPICCEDLDLTDSSFLPCSCGFHLCLFCHKRIIEEDGRCPGCRKPYDSSDPVEETSVSGVQGDQTIRLARSCSMSCSRA